MERWLRSRKFQRRRSSVELRAEMNVLTILNTCQHPLDPSPQVCAQAGAAWRSAAYRPLRPTIPADVSAREWPRLHADREVFPMTATQTTAEQARAGISGLHRRGARWRTVDPRDQRKGSTSASWTCTATRPSTRCSTTRTITPTATARRTRSASRAISISQPARKLHLDERQRAADHRRGHLRPPRHARRRLRQRKQHGALRHREAPHARLPQQLSEGDLPSGATAWRSATSPATSTSS